MQHHFFSAFKESDWVGKMIYFSLYGLSILSWSLLLYKIWLYKQVEKKNADFQAQFEIEKLLSLRFSMKTLWVEVPNPLFSLYKEAKQKTFQLMKKNRGETLLSPDIALLETSIHQMIVKQKALLEKNVDFLSTIVTLGPFLGLLGTVWGILVSFNALEKKGSFLSNTHMLSGLSMALTTTVIGLLIAIPALIGHNYLKNRSAKLCLKMQDFAQELLCSIELQYRCVSNEKMADEP